MKKMYLMFAAITVAEFAMKAIIRRIRIAQTPPQQTKVLLLEEYAGTTVSEVRHLGKRWKVWKDDLHRAHEAYINYDTIEVTEDGLVVVVASRVIKYDGRKRVRGLTYRSCGKSWAEGARRLFERGYYAATAAHVEDLLLEGRLEMRPPHVTDYKPSARRIADGIEAEIARCPSASWKIGKEVK